MPKMKYTDKCKKKKKNQYTDNYKKKKYQEKFQPTSSRSCVCNTLFPF